MGGSERSEHRVVLDLSGVDPQRLVKVAAAYRELVERHRRAKADSPMLGQLELFSDADEHMHVPYVPQSDA